MKFKKFGRWLIPVLVAIVFAFLFLGNDSIINVLKLRGDVTQKQRDIPRMHRENDSLVLEQKKLKTDTSYIEKIAREKLGMARKNEKVYKFIEDK